MVTLASSLVDARLQLWVDAVDGSATPGQMVVLDASDNPLVTFTLSVPSFTISNRVATITATVAVATADGIPMSAELRNGDGDLVDTLSVPQDVSIVPRPITAGTLASLVGQVVGN